MKKSTIYLEEEDERKLEAIKKATGLKRKADANRLAIRSYRLPKHD